jgi:PTS system cellobiose-specific IIB component
MLVDKMKDIAKRENIEVDIDALAFDRADMRLENTDVLLFGPQVRHLLPKFRAKYNGKIPVIEAINISDYGLLNGEKILKESLDKLEAAKSE